MDSWGIELACKLIVLGYNLDVAETINYGIRECPHGSTGNDRAIAIHTVMDRALTLAKSAVAIGKVKDTDTPANWLAWAQSKGYSVAHLTPAPSGTSEKAAPPVPMVTDANLPAGVPAAEIISKFKLDTTWVEKLKHIDRNPFLKTSGALMQQGCRKSATSKGMPNLFNPVKFAEMLMAREGKTAQQMKRVIESRFPRWQDAWDTAQSVDAPAGWED